MSTREKFAQDLLMKEERISAWETFGLNNGILDRQTVYCKMPKIEYLDFDVR